MIAVKLHKIAEEFRWGKIGEEVCAEDVDGREMTEKVKFIRDTKSSVKVSSTWKREGMM